MRFPTLDIFEIASLCVEDCPSYDYSFSNNKNTMQCEYCGYGCTLCSPVEGCLQSFSLGHGFRINSDYQTSVGLYSDIAPSNHFKTISECADSRCDKCQLYDYALVKTGQYQCDSCYQYYGIGLYTAQ
jgi:hypothetical protein